MILGIGFCAADVNLSCVAIEGLDEDIEAIWDCLCLERLCRSRDRHEQLVRREGGAIRDSSSAGDDDNRNRIGRGVDHLDRRYCSSLRFFAHKYLSTP